jgi:hypothetical protein
MRHLFTFLHFSYIKTYILFINASSLLPYQSERRLRHMYNFDEPACWLENDGARITPFYAQEVFCQGSPTWLSYLCSRANSTFTVIVDCRLYIQRMCTVAFPDVQAMLYIDGIEVAALVTDVRIGETLLEFEGVYDGDEAIRPFRFEKLVRR